MPGQFGVVMNKAAVLGFIKKNILSLSSGLVAILCIAATFYPLGGMQDQLKDEAQTAAQDYSTLQALSKPRNLPTTNPTQTDPGKLANFPNLATINWGNDQKAKFAKASQSILQSVQELSAKGHETVVPGAFAPTSPQAVLYAFATTYGLVLTTDPTISGVGDPSASPPLAADPTLHQYNQLNIQNDILHGCLPPTPEDILQAGAKLKVEKYDPMVILKNGVPVNQLELDTQWNTERATLGLKMKRGAALHHKMYVEKDAFTVNTAISPHDPPTLENMWYAQLQVWMQRDLAYAIADENSKSNSILTSPVKRLLQMSVPVAGLYVVPPPAAGAASPGGIPSAAKDTEAITPNFTVSPFGRYSNGMYDVLAFEMTVDVDASKVNEFIETLSRGRLISVNVQSEFALDSAAESRNGYLYGSSPMVRIVLDGEMLYMRSWTQDLMPEKVKMALGLIPGGTPGQMPTGVPGGMPGGVPGMPGGMGMPPGGYPNMSPR